MILGMLHELDVAKTGTRFVSVEKSNRRCVVKRHYLCHVRVFRRNGGASSRRRKSREWLSVSPPTSGRSLPRVFRVLGSMLLGGR